MTRVLSILTLFPVLALAAEPPTFSKDIAPLVYANCSSCHHDGEVAPFNLLTYHDVQKRAKQIVKVTNSRQMPPWHAEPGFGDFQSDRRLSESQLATFKSWLDAGCPEGDARDLPPVPRYTEGWQLGQPDIIVKMPEAYPIKADGPDVFRVFVMPFDVPEGKYVKAVDFRPGNRKITHHAMTFLDSTGAARKLDAADPGPGYSAMGGVGFLPTGGMGGWAPGAPPHRFPDGAAKAIAKGTDLVLQIHFHPSGKAESEQAMLGIYLTDEKPTRSLVTLPLGVRSTIDIAPGVKNYKWADSITLPVAVEVPGLTPHAHYLCKDMQVWATLPTGEKQWLIWIKDWDFNWQGQYRYKAPIKLPAGTKISMEYTYDNTAENPRNPSSPPKRVHRGEQTTDEMGITFIQAIPENQAGALALRKAMRDHFLGANLSALLGGGGSASAPAKK